MGSNNGKIKSLKEGEAVKLKVGRKGGVNETPF